MNCQLLYFRATEFLYGMVTGTYAINALFLQSYGLSAGLVGLVMGLNMLMGAIGAPIWGLVADKMCSRGKAFAITCLGTALVAALVPTSAAIRIGGTLMVVFFLPGINFFRNATCTLLDGIVVSAGQINHTIHYSTLRMYQSVGYSFISVVYTPIVDTLGIQAPFYITAGLSVLCFFAGKKLQGNDNKNSIENVRMAKKNLSVGRLFHHYYLVVILFLNLLLQFPNNVTQFTSYLLLEIGLEGSLASMVSGLRVLGEITVLVLAVALRRKLTQPVMILLSAACFLIEALLYPFCENLWTVIATNMLGGVGYGFLLGSMVDLVYLLAPMGLESTALALFSAGAPIAGILSTYLGGQILQQSGIYGLYTSCVLLMGIFLVAFICLFWYGYYVHHWPLPGGFLRQK